jgi:ribosomal protein S18 acetylase RimI-like enzyme
LGVTTRTDVRLASASTLSLEALAALFTAAYEGYAIPVHFDVDGISRLVETSDLDLDAGLVALADDRPVGLCMLGIRRRDGWIGGMGVVAAYRRAGIGALLMRAVLGEARARRLGRVRLEVLQENDPARLLYEKLGFEHIRMVDVWTFDGEVPPGGGRGRLVAADVAQAFVREHRAAAEPWQRADGTLVHLDSLQGVSVDGGAAVYRAAAGRVLLLQAVASSERAATALVAALRAQGESVVALNLPSGDPCAAAIERLGGRLEVRQYEMALTL